MDGKINDYLTSADSEGLLNIIYVNAERPRPLKYNSLDLIGTVEDPESGKAPNVHPGNPPEDWEDPLTPK